MQLRVFAFIAVSGLFGGLVFNGATIALPKLLAERLPEASLGAVGAIAALVFAAAAFAQLPVGRLLDHWGARPLLFAIEGAKAPLLLAMALTPGGGRRRPGPAGHAAGVRRDPDHRLAARPPSRRALVVARLRGAVPAVAGRRRPPPCR